MPFSLGVKRLEPSSSDGGADSIRRCLPEMAFCIAGCGSGSSSVSCTYKEFPELHSCRFETFFYYRETETKIPALIVFIQSSRSSSLAQLKYQLRFCRGEKS